MKTKKIIALMLALAFILTAFAACSSNKTNEESTNDEALSEEVSAAEEVSETSEDAVKVSFLKGPTGMGAAYMWTQSDNGETLNNYSITLDTDATTVGPKLMTGEYDIAAIPTNLAASLYQKSQGKVKVLAVNTLGVLYLVTKNNAVTSLDDLKGKTILASGEGTIAEYALDFVLEKYGYEIGKDVNIEFTTEHSESVAKALAGGYDVLLLPEPFVSQIMAKDSSFTIGVNLTEAWETYGDCTLTMGCIAVNTAFYENHKEEVNNFIKDYSESVKFVNENIDEAAQMIESHDIMAAAVAKNAIPNSNIVCYTNDEMKTALTSCYTVLLDQNAKIIGGSMPADDFYIYVEG